MSALLALLVLCFYGTTVCAAGPSFDFNIPSGDARKTLQDFYSQSKIEMLYLTDTVRGTKTNPVTGRLDASQALEQMLEGTGLEYSFEDDFSFVAITPRVELQGTAEHVEPVRASARSYTRNQSEHTQELLGSDVELEQVVITGTLIRGVLDIMSPLEFVTRKEMKKTNYATVQDALQTLPVNLGGGPSEDFTTVGNFARGSSANLRGLGAGATLVLVNGHRQPYSGTEADFVDLSNIAWSAVDRIEVLPDGASALYGSDAIAGVVNVIMRKKFDGAETQVRLGTAPGGGDERLIGQLFGKTWDSGNILLSYQFSERTSLPAAARGYAASADKRAFGGADHRSIRSDPGNILNPATFLPAYGIPTGQDGRSLTASDLLASSINLQNQYSDVEILPNRSMHGVFLSGAQKLGEHFALFGEARFNDRHIRQDYIAIDQVLVVPSSNAFFVSPYPGARTALVSYSFLDDLGPLQLSAHTQTFSGTFGTEAALSDSWKLKLSGSYGREAMHYVGANQPNQVALRAALADRNRETAFNPFGDGSSTNPATIEAIRESRRVDSVSGITATNLTADGNAFDLRTGPVKLALGTEWREERLARGVTVRNSFDRTVESLFAELAIPLIGRPEDARAVPRMELSLAGRYERYSDFGDSTNPKIGLRWAPLNSLKLRTSWGTSFKAPKLVNVYDLSNNLTGLISLRDPKSAVGSSLVLAVQGNNPDLTQETASTWTAGLDLAPPMFDGLNLSLTYYAIDYDNRILVPGPISPFDILLQEDQWGSVIHRNPTQADIDAACAAGSLTGGSVSQCKATPFAAIVDLRVRNMASTRVRGIDMKLDHSVRTRYGRFDFGVNGGYVLSFRQAASDATPMTDVVDTVGNPLALRLRGSADWYQHGWDQSGFGVSAAVDRFGGYKDVDSSMVSKVAPFTMVDLRLSYRTVNGSGAFDGIELGLNAANIFNASPPFVDIETGYDVANAEPYGRVVSFSIQKSW